MSSPWTVHTHDAMETESKWKDRRKTGGVLPKVLSRLFSFHKQIFKKISLHLQFNVKQKTDMGEIKNQEDIN
jgi:hypothetical protein